MSSSPEGAQSLPMLDVERPMLPTKKNSLYAFAQRGIVGDEERLQLRKSGLYRLIPHCMRIKYADQLQESLYEKYYTSQKQVDLVGFLIAAICFQVYLALKYALKGIDLNNSLELASLIFLILAFVFNVSVIVVYKMQLKVLRQKRAIRWIFPVLVFLALYGNFFIDLFATHHPLLTSDGITFHILFIFATMTMLPLPVIYCAMLAVISSAGLLILHGFKAAGVKETEMPAAVVLCIGSMALGLVAAFVADKKQRRAFRQARVTIAMKLVLEQQSQEQERLLLAVLPKHIASQIRHDLGAVVHGQFKKIYMDRYENVSILFADIVGFTALSSQCTAAELVKLLNKLIARFDKLSEKYHQLRIKILGDCYYCISGAPEPRSDHAVLCCHMGLAMVEAIKAVREETNSGVDMRVGIHTGSVLAGVMGQRQYAYDVYSKDTKLANAMEAGGIPGRVHISESTYGCLHGEFEVVPGNGDTRNEDIRKAGLQTYLIERTIKAYPEGTIDATSRLSLNHDGPLSSRRPSSRPGAHVTRNAYELSEEDFDKRLKQALIEREGATLKEKGNHLTLRFNDEKLEKQYGAVQDKLGAAVITAVFGVVVFSCVVHGILWSFNTGTALAYAAVLTVTFTMSFVSWAPVNPTRFPNAVTKFIRWTETAPRLRYAWLTFVVLFSALPEIADRLTCRPEAHSCDPPVFYLHLTAFLLLGIACLIQMRHLVKVVIMAVLVATHCLLTTLMQPDIFDDYDRRHYQNFDRVWFRTKYYSCLRLLMVWVALYWLNRCTETTSRLLFIWKKESDAQKEEVGDLRKKNEELVANILPRHVAMHFLGRNITETEEPYSEHHAAVGVMFASMPNFAEFYSEDSINKHGLECLRFLNEVICDYDALLDASQFNGSITKIKTIGATYMVASGLTSTDDYDHQTSTRIKWSQLSDLVGFALAMQEKLKEINLQSFNQFYMRIGINHGPISAGVIGAKKPHYDIWGNTVNVASRMESTGRPNSIQVTEETMNLLKEFGYQFEARGKVFVKGKGELSTYYLIGRDAQVAANGFNPDSSKL